MNGLALVGVLSSVCALDVAPLGRAFCEIRVDGPCEQDQEGVNKSQSLGWFDDSTHGGPPVTSWTACHERLKSWEIFCGKRATIAVRYDVFGRRAHPHPRTCRTGQPCDENDGVPRAHRRKEWTAGDDGKLGWAEFIARLGLDEAADGLCYIATSGVRAGAGGRLTAPCAVLREYVRRAVGRDGNAPPPAARSEPRSGAGARRTLRVAVFGGSISRGHGCKLGYAVQLEDVARRLGVNATVSNFAIPATGVEPLLDCATDLGASPPDVLVSEFAVNEGDAARLRAWYGAAAAMAPHVVDLELWTWAAWDAPHPATPSAAAIAAIEARDRRGLSIGVVDTAAGAQPFWPARSPFTPRELFPSHTGDWTDPQQHGNDGYHALAALALSWYLFGDWASEVTASAASAATRPRDEAGPSASLQRMRCYGSYGMWEGWSAADEEAARASGRVAANSKLPPPRPPLTSGSLGIAEGEFRYGDPFNRPAVSGAYKRSLHAAEVGASFSFVAPTCCSGVKLGFVKHNSASDGAVFEVAIADARHSVATCEPPCEPCEPPSCHPMHVVSFTPMMSAHSGATVTIRILELGSSKSVVEITAVGLQGCAQTDA